MFCLGNHICFMCMSVCLRVCIPHVYTRGGWKRISDLLELELRVNHLTWVLRTEPGSSASAFYCEHFSIPSSVVLKCELCRQMMVSQQNLFCPWWPMAHTPGFCCWCFGGRFDAGPDPVVQMGLSFIVMLLSQPLKYWDWRCVPLVLLLYSVPSLSLECRWVCVCVSDY